MAVNVYAEFSNREAAAAQLETQELDWEGGKTPVIYTELLTKLYPDQCLAVMIRIRDQDILRVFLEENLQDFLRHIEQTERTPWWEIVGYCAIPRNRACLLNKFTGVGTAL